MVGAALTGGGFPPLLLPLPPPPPPQAESDKIVIITVVRGIQVLMVTSLSSVAAGRIAAHRTPDY
jgi:hypothetical protein